MTTYFEGGHPPSLPYAETEEDRKKSRYKLIDDLGIGSRYRECYFNNPSWEATPMLEATKRFVDNNKTFLVLTGNTGSGKTVASIAWLVEMNELNMLAKGKRGLFVESVGVRHALGYGEQERYYREAMMKAPYLVLDDLQGLGEGGVTPAFVTTINDVINERYNHQRKTIITSNLPPDILFKTYGDRVHSRVESDGDILIAESVDRRFM